MTDLVHETRKVRRLIERAGVAMFTTLDDRGAFASRPMLPLLLEEDPHLYFLTHRDSRKVAQVSSGSQVGVTIGSGTRCYVSMVGRAQAVHDRAMIDRLWRPTYRAWFPDGAGDREAIVLRVDVTLVEYWEPPRSPLARVVQAAAAIITRKPIENPKRTLEGL